MRRWILLIISLLLLEWLVLDFVFRKPILISVHPSDMDVMGTDKVQIETWVGKGVVERRIYEKANP